MPMYGEGEYTPAVFAAYLDNISNRCCAFARKFMLQFQRALDSLALNRLKRLKFLALIIGNEIAVYEHVEKVAHERSCREFRQHSMDMPVPP